MTPVGHAEYHIEKATMDLFQELSWEVTSARDEHFGPGGTLGRDNKSEVLLLSRLRPALQRLNPDLPQEAFDLAVEELLRDRSRMDQAAANREVYQLLKQGVPVRIPDPEGDGDQAETVRLIDWNEPSNNDFLLVSQFAITGEMYTCIPDLTGFVNGIPLLLFELKASHVPVHDAFSHNLTHYKQAIPHLFWYNAFIILSNGSETKVGSVTSSYEHFNDWKKVVSEEEEGVISLETVIRGTCQRERFLDIVENLIVFMEAQGGLIKLVAKNHQYLGVSSAMEALADIRNREGKLGVFWHTQGSGKSVSMVFFSQKVLRRIPGNWTFVIVTDRRELDEQIYRTFTSCGAITEGHCQAESSADLRRLLTEDHRFVFTLIHKFRTDDGKPHPILAERDDIIVITDEAHRSQYDTLALNMRNALPNASFIAFTGTPLIIGEERTRDVFGEYISVYDFRQSIEDGATVPLFYENRIPELQLKDDKAFEEGLDRILEEAELDEDQEKKLEREFAREYHLITRDERLDKIAHDIVEHFTERGQRGKAMVVSIDKATAVKMYDKVVHEWGEKTKRLREALSALQGPEKEAIEEQIAYMEETDMAVVVSASQNEIPEMKAKGVDIEPHRRRMVNEDLATKFKDPDNPFRIVFVCAMWMTGFDVPSCNAIYLDRPMKNHTLMQTIARANRVFKDKVNGLIVDYVGVFRNLQKALAIYAPGSGDVERPIKNKAELVQMLREAIGQTEEFLEGLGVKLNDILEAEGFERVGLVDGAVEAILINDETKRQFMNHASIVRRIFKAILPDPDANELVPSVSAIRAMQLKIQGLLPKPDISDVMGRVERLLDASIAAFDILEPYGDEERYFDLGRFLKDIDFEELWKRFVKGRKRKEIERLKTSIAQALTEMVRKNKTRTEFLEKFQAIIDEYNQRRDKTRDEEFFKRLIEFARELQQEDQRAVSENLTEEELAIFDLITKPDMKLTKKETEQVKKIAHNLLETLQREMLVLDWRKRQSTRAAVQLTVQDKLEGLPASFTDALYSQKCDVVFQHLFEAYQGAGQSIYVVA